MRLCVLLALCILIFSQGCESENTANIEKNNFKVIDMENDGKNLEIHEFSKIEIGMTYSEVVEAIGEPSSKLGSGFTWDTYKIDDGWFVDLLFLGEPSTLTAMRIVDYKNNRKFVLMEDLDQY